MRFLLIGGNGFIGPHVRADLENRGHEIFVLHRPRTHAAPGRREIFADRRRLADHASELRALAPDVVVDLILSSGRQARELIDVFAGAAGRVVALSSCDVYRACGITHGLEAGPLEPVPLTESSALRTKLQTYPPAQVQMLQQIFGWVDDEYDKIPVEREIMSSAALPATVLRLPMVYGPRDPLHRFMPVVKRAADQRRTMAMSEEMAGWRATKGYVENVGAAIALAAASDRAANQIYNVGEPDAPTELEWARAIATELGWTGEFVLRPDAQLPPPLRAPGNTAQQWVTDTTKLRAELGFEEPVSREEAIRRTVEWERANPPAGFTPHHFDYAAEDAALSSGRASMPPSATSA